MEHGAVGHGPGSLHDEITRVPLIMDGPGLPEGVVIDQIVEKIDLAPTILDYTGHPSPHYFQGQSLLPLLRGDREVSWDEYAIAEDHQAGRHSRALVTEHWKLLQDQPDETVCKLFNIVEDPGETHDLTLSFPEVTARLQARLPDLIFLRNEEMSFPPESTRISADILEETTSKLRSLGYLR